ncbi:M48 family metallopeptidase [Hymenobacter sp. BT635]|uniref:M48 family metallopeptidase n=1 Tax=Hymenobacter nitidus TaxID=2880929 RepID=A0ABS8AFN4_9BACT|nr:M48 family metallopeptidase [Hymenobacter nitidus]MCB2378259.1 M48 family metallopeptidase [Hymenobacter nitidus]
MFRLVLLVCLAALHFLPAAAQDQPYLPYYSRDTAQVYQLAVAHRNAIKDHLVVPKTGSSEYRDHYRKIVKETSDEVFNSIRYSALLDPTVEPYVQQVFRRILAANPQLPATAKLVLSRNPQPNAHAVGTSTVMLNIGLLPRLENESQLAFILCHELAHVACRHMQTSMQEHLLAVHSKEMKREYRRILNSEYNISSQIKALALGFSLNSNYHHRRYERQADSLGYVLLSRTSYDASQAYRALELLDTIDQPETAGPLPLSAYFNCAEFPRTFAAAENKPKSIFTVKAAEKTVLETTDTLKSHPDCAKRMRFVRTLARDQVAAGPQAASTPEFARIRHISRLEVIQSWFDYDCYDHALFDALLLLPQQPQNSYLRSVVLLSLYELQQHLQGHTYNEVVSTISPRNSAPFNDLLRVLYDLRHDEFKGLSACFAQANEPGQADEYALAARYAAMALAAEPATAASLKAQLQKQYAGGRFEKLLFPVPPTKAGAARH